MKWVYVEFVFLVIVDESCYGEVDVVCCYGFFYGVNIKLMKCGGFILVCCMVEYVCSFGLKVMVGCMMEFLVGIFVIVQLFFLFDYVDMDGVFLLKEDLVVGVEVRLDGVVFFNWNGMGVVLW